jgi:hypothetical protein
MERLGVTTAADLQPDTLAERYYVTYLLPMES